MRKGFVALCLLACFVMLPGLANAKKYTLRIATLAPKGSSWMKVFNAMKWELRKKSKKKIRLKFYSGGSMGDESLVVRKIRSGKLQGGSFTAIGLIKMAPSILALQLPFMFRKYGELYYVRRKLDGFLRKKFEDKGMILLGWADLGYIYLFSANKITNLKDLRAAKVWGWTDDPMTKRFAKSAGITPRLLGLLHVRAGLQTGSVNTVVSTPLTLIAMQWHTYVKHRVKYRFAIGLGATVISKKSFDAMPENLQKILLKVAKKYHKILNKVVRRDNRKSLKTLKKSGLISNKLAKKEKKLMRKVAKKVRKYFTGKLFTKADLKKILDARREYRRKKRKKK